MCTSLLSDFSRVLLFPKDSKYVGKLNPLHKRLTEELGGGYRPLDYFEFNTELLDFYKSLKGKYSIHLLTTDVIQNHPDIKQHIDTLFDGVFSANDLGRKKNDPDTYLLISKTLNIRPETVVFIDDQIENVDAAQAAGMKALHYENDNKKTIAEIRAFLAP